MLLKIKRTGMLPKLSKAAMIGFLWGNTPFYKQWPLEIVWQSDVQRMKVAAGKLFQHPCSLFTRPFCNRWV
jgi:hypothetical protein